MKWLATGLLLAAAAIYVVAESAGWYYVAAASEAALIGALADWFAVVALFRRPLGLPIPHTAILPRNKARIARGLSQFIQQNFLSSEALVQRIAQFRPADTLCRWLLAPGNAGTVATYAARFVAYALGAVDDERVRRFLHQTAASALKRADLAGFAAQILDLLTADKRHHALFDAALGGLDEVLAKEDTRRFIAAEVAKSAPLLKVLSDWFGLKLDERAALKIVEVAIAKVGDVRRDQEHELRARFDAFVFRFIEKLKTDGQTRATVEQIKEDVLKNPALADYLGGLWRQFRDWLSADLAATPSVTHERIAGMVVAFGGRLEEDREIRQWIDEQILAAIPPLVSEHRARIGRFVEDQINGWQETKLVEEIERHIGRDLQYIRVNGTIVGALAGLTIAYLTRMAH